MNQILHISIPEKVYSTLERTAKTTKQPLEKVAADWLERAAEASEDPLMALVGSISSEDDVRDWADNHDKYLGENLARSLKE